MKTAAIVPAAGRGDRLGPGLPKALRVLGGAPLLVHAVRALARSRAVSLVVVAAPPDGVSDVRALLSGHHAGADLLVVAGGASRRESVRLALDVLPLDFEAVLVHDAARPLTPIELIDAVAAAVHGGADAVIPSLPVADTVKRVQPRVDPADRTGERVVETVDRTSLRAVQTPQGFRRPVLAAAHLAASVAASGTASVAATGAADASPEATDDAELVERLGGTVLVIAGEEDAFKVTRPLDFLLAEAVLARRRTDGVS